MEWLTTISLAMGSAWTSGINLYATVMILGLLQKIGFHKLPGGLEVLDNWWVIGIATGLFVVQFFADKIPYFDAIWDVVHTFIRIPAGALMAYTATNDFDPTIKVVALLLGGGVALTSHGTVLSARLAANLSPEPFTNWALSIIKDIFAVVGAFLAFFLPIFLAIFVVIFVGIFIWFAPKIFRTVLRIFRAVRGFFGGEDTLAVEFRKV
jgi:Domain of unknown function (DUF4126)